MMMHGPLASNTSAELHHIVKIIDNPAKRMDKNNWLAVCNSCHNEVEGDIIAGMTVRQWSDTNYDKVLRNACQDENLLREQLKN